MKLNHTHIALLAQQCAAKITDETGRTDVAVYAVPRGGVPAAYAVNRYLPRMQLVAEPQDAEVFIDDVIDSGSTLRRYAHQYPGRPFYALIDKNEPQYRGNFIVFPWEGTDVEGAVEDNVIRMLQAVGEDPTRGGLLETPARVVKAWQFWCSGYKQNPADVLKVFEDGAKDYDEMVTVKDLPFYSHCEHHMAAIIGTATVSYIPCGKIVGLSKLKRLVDVFAHRLQVQERMTCQIADALFKHLGPIGVGVVLKARHMCMESRGVRAQGHHTITTAMRGSFSEFGPSRDEFLRTAV